MDYMVSEESSKKEAKLVLEGLVKYNLSKVPATQNQSFIPINRVIRDSKGEIVAGINSVLYCWNCLFIDVLWVKEGHRKEGYGSTLINEVEKIAKEKGCYLIHLDTFDFQAKDFYIKHGYEVFGVIEDCPALHKRYYMKKCI